MKYIKNIEAYHESYETIVTLGKFDGFHKGHVKLLSEAADYKKEWEKNAPELAPLKTIVFAFDMLEFKQGFDINYKQLMLNKERRSFLEGQVDHLIECPFIEQIRIMEAEAFIREVLVERLHARCIVVGQDFCFGYLAKGNVNLLLQLSSKYGYDVIVVKKEMYGEEEISSTYIKKCLASGDLETCKEMLGYDYYVDGTVIKGNQIGRTIGFPTMNILPSKDKYLPRYGVYFVEVIQQGILYSGIANVGRKPTVADNGEVLIETYLFEYVGENYGESICVFFKEFIRDEKKFHNIEALKAQINLDKTKVSMKASIKESTKEPTNESINESIKNI